MGCLGVGKFGDCLSVCLSMVLTECVEMLVLVCGLSILPSVLSKWICIQVFRLIFLFFYFIFANNYMEIFGKKYKKIFVLMHFFFLMKCVLTTKLVIIQETLHWTVQTDSVNIDMFACILK